ncbi:MAG: hypothetical protein CMH50_06655 [Myxococcales bacterium]|nr:hypothetical protein [Myxococcales bacterium]
MSVADELKKLAELRDSGVLSDEEFAEQKARLLAGDVAEAGDDKASDTASSIEEPVVSSQRAVEDDERGQAPAWAYVLLILVAAFGVFVGGLMTHHHDVMSYDPNAQEGQLIGCAADEGVNCDVVNTSSYSEVMGIPIATLAIPVYLLVLILSVIGLMKKRREPLTLILALGVGMSLYSVFLFYISKVELQNLCTWCVRNYIASFAVLGIALIAGAWRDRVVPMALVKASVLLLVGATLLAMGGERMYRQSLIGDQPKELSKQADAAKLSSSDEGGVLEPRSFKSFAVDRRGREIVYGTVKIGPGNRWRGNPKAEVVVIEYADLECPICRNAAVHFDRLYAAYGDRVLFVYKHFPINRRCNSHVRRSKHNYACIAAKASECAGDQGHFWHYLETTFRNQHNLGARSLRSHAKALGLDMKKFNQCLRKRGTPDGVKNDTDELGGLEKMRKSTPKVLINGELYTGGLSAEGLAREIERRLGTDEGQAAFLAEAFGGGDNAPSEIPQDLSEMQSIEYGDLKFQIDRFEAGRDDDGKAVTGKRVIPSTGVTWHGAKEACEAAGKRLCRAEEWFAACQGAAPKDDNGNGRIFDDRIEGSLYPYGDVHRPGRCWDGHKRNAYRPVYTGEHPACVSRDGVYDLTGNMAEWVGDTPGKAVLMGGFYEDRRPSCLTYDPNWGPSQSSIYTGFRCCSGGEGK